MAEHWQSCFDVQTRRCVCPIGNREERVRQAAPEMESFLRAIEFKIIGQRNDTAARTCYFCFKTEKEGHLSDCGLGELLARIDGTKAG